MVNGKGTETQNSKTNTLTIFQGSTHIHVPQKLQAAYYDLHDCDTGFTVLNCCRTMELLYFNILRLMKRLLQYEVHPLDLEVLAT